jgi:hypothetical protein
MIGRQNQLDARSFCFFLDFERLRHHFVLDERFPDRVTVRLKKRVRHRAADQELIDFSLDQRFDHGDFI